MRERHELIHDSGGALSFEHLTMCVDLLNELRDTRIESIAARRVDFVGGLHIRLEDRRDVATHGKNNTALRAYLLLQPTRSVPGTDAEQFLWSQRSPEQAKASLRQCLSDLRKQLGPIGNLRIESDRREISVAAQGIRYKLKGFEDLEHCWGVRGEAYGE